MQIGSDVNLRKKIQDTFYAFDINLVLIQKVFLKIQEDILLRNIQQWENNSPSTWKWLKIFAAFILKY